VVVGGWGARRRALQASRQAGIQHGGCYEERWLVNERAACNT
jgi:hypothetical protein